MFYLEFCKKSNVLRYHKVLYLYIHLMNYTKKEFEQLEDKILQMEAYLIKNDKLVSLGSQVAGVTHEISTPIGLGVTGMSHFISETKRLRELFNTEEMTQEDFENYLNNAEKTADIVYNNLFIAKSTIQSFKRIAIDKSREVKRSFNLNEYMQEIITSLHNKIKHTKVTISTHITDDIIIDSYPGSYSHIFTNLIMNSLVHAFRDDEAGEIDIDATQDENNIYIEYKDNGRGIPKEIIDKIYEPFFTTKAESGGSGLGMQIVNKLITEELKGSISVSSQEDAGVLFRLTLPKEIV